MTSARQRTDSGAERTPQESSPRAGWRETAEAMEVDAGLPAYLNENRDELAAIAAQDYPISPILSMLLARHALGEI